MDNAQDSINKGRNAHSISDELVEVILSEHQMGMAQNVIAQNHGIHYSTVSLLVRGLRRKNILGTLDAHTRMPLANPKEG